MNRYTTNDSSFTMEALQKAMKLVELPIIDFAPLNDYINAGNKMTDTLTMITDRVELMDVGEINTVHGKLKIIYSRYSEPGKVYFMSPKNLEEMLKPDFKFK